MATAVRDLLDNQVVDSKGRKVGKVDGIIVEIEEGKQPRITHIEMGTVTLARRLSLRLGRWMYVFQQLVGINTHDPYRIRWSKFKKVGVDIQLDESASGGPLLAWSEWIDKKIIKRLPGGGG